MADLHPRRCSSFTDVQNDCDPGIYEQAVQIALDSTGNLYIADGRNHRIRRISTAAVISTVAGSGSRPEVNGRCEPTSPIGDGAPALESRLYSPSGIAALPNGDLIIADQQNNRIRKVDGRAGAITTIAGSGQHNIYAPNIPATASPMDWPSAIAVDVSGASYFSEVHSHRVGRIGSDGRITTVAGTGFPAYNGDNRRATSAQLWSPMELAFHAAGNLLHRR